MVRRIHLSRTVVVRSLVVAVVAAALAWPAVSSAVSLTLPKGIDATTAKRMYAEQLDSQANIERLVDGKIASMQVVDRKVTKGTAELQLRVTDTDGIVRRGVMKLVKADGKWYFSSIGRLGNDTSAVSPVGRPDTGVLNTILSEQTQHADTTAKLVDGTYTTVRIGKPKAGFRSVVLPVIFTGRSTRAATGQVTAVKRTVQGSDDWFVVSFESK